MKSSKVNRRKFIKYAASLSSSVVLSPIVSHDAFGKSDLQRDLYWYQRPLRILQTKGCRQTSRVKLLSNGYLNEGVFGEILIGNTQQIVRRDSVDPRNHILIVAMRKVIENYAFYFVSMGK